MNKEKTTGLYIGKLKYSKPRYQDINWTKSYVTTLGVCHGYDIDNDDIWRENSNKIKSLEIKEFDFTGKSSFS